MVFVPGQEPGAQPSLSREPLSKERGLTTLWADLSGGTVIWTYHATSPLALITLPN
ncbi:hypothetical protein CHELA1G11_12223 [Hyphomicrobiales bacterium]|nr:hypothetical protein CHELA1G2_12089 [Hyphomicrobiales bacterium]CAH1663340.1 hypothetical protein CHELA1G11_12223 [Hyphomicrobiales bacterium]